MTSIIPNKYVFQRNVIPIIGICLTCYFSFHAIFGERSYFKYQYLDKRVENLSFQYKSLKDERKILENKVVRLRPDSIDMDLLEEQSRTVLGFVYQSDVIILDDLSGKN